MFAGTLWCAVQSFQAIVFDFAASNIFINYTPMVKVYVILNSRAKKCVRNIEIASWWALFYFM